MNTLTRLQARHRLEEICERFRLRPEVVEGGLRLPFAALSEHAPVESKALDAGLECDGAGVRLPYTTEISALEDRLLAFLGGLLEANPEPFLRRPRAGIQIPAAATLPESAQWLERFYGEGFLPREKKPAVVDLNGCQGAYLRSVDAEPLQIVDAASQIASKAAGFRPDAVQSTLDEGGFDPFMVAAHDPKSRSARAVVEGYARDLLAVCPPMTHVAFVNGGAEANEKAFQIAREHGPGGRRVIAFEGSFHGRTLLSLFSTWNPVKREPYQLPGFETTFVAFPEPDQPSSDPAIPEGWRSAWSNPADKRTWTGGAELEREVAALHAVEGEILRGDVLAVIIEPFQCEGGDRPATRRFFHGLRALTRGHGVPLIFDEVQSGFGLSGPVFWHQAFNLLDAEGNPDGPDLVVGAKRAQIGYVLSRWADPEPGPSHVASMVRGREHLHLVMSKPGHQRLARRCLETLLANWSGVVSRPRVFGDAFAFDMPSREAANHLIGQRFYRGYMVYIAGQRTLRYRLNRGMEARDVEAIFGVIDASLHALVEQAGGPGEDLAERMATCKPPKWSEPLSGPEATPAPPTAVTTRRIDVAGFDALAEAIVELQAEAYEPERQDSVQYFRNLLQTQGAIGLVAEDEQGLVGFTIGGPLELWPDLDGPRQDPHRGAGQTLYSADLTVAARARGRGVGRALRVAMLQAALLERRDGEPRYAFVSGRNRVGAADPMWNLNRRYGAYEVAIYAGQYGSVEGLARYYRIPLRRHDRRAFVSPSKRARLDCSGVHLPTGANHPLLERGRALGLFDEAALSKLTVSNFITRPYARYAEYLRHVAPRANRHLYFTSSPDEMVDKTIRALKHKRSDGRLVVGLEGGHLGTVTAAARSLSGDGSLNPDQGFFGWPLVPHPTGDAACIAALDALVDEYTAEGLIGVFVEAVQARTGRVLDAESWAALCAWRDRTGVPLVLVETCTGLYRNGDGMWWVDTVDGDADVVLWWAGGQIGHVFSSEETFVSKPLTLISTWDGDELSATRLLWQLYACDEVSPSARTSELDAVLRRHFMDAERFPNAQLGGRGLYRTVRLEGGAGALRAALARRGVDVGHPREHLLVFAPPVTVSSADLNVLDWALGQAAPSPQAPARLT